MKKRIAGVSIVLFVAAVFLLAHYLLPRKVEAMLRDEISQALDPDYHTVTIEDLSFKLFFTGMNLGEVSVKLRNKDFSDSLLKQMPRQLMEAELRGLRIATGGLIALARKKKQVTLSSFTIDSLGLKIYSNARGVEPLDGEEKKPMPDILDIRNIKMNHINLEGYTLMDGAALSFEVSKAQLAGNLRIQQQPEGSNPLVQVSNPSLSTSGLFYNDTLYTYGLDSLSLEGTTFTAFQLKMESHYDKNEFSRRITWQDDRMDILVDTLRIEGFNLSEIISHRRLVSPSVSINGGSLEAYRDKNVPFNLARRPALPTRLIREASPGIDIREILVNNLDIYYVELPEGKQVAGKVPFNNLHAVITNITNLPQELEADSMMLLHAQAKTIGDTDLEAEFAYNLKDPNGGFTATGKLGAFAFKALNEVIYPLAGIEINEGTHHGSAFRFSGNDDHARGTLNMEYSDLEITLEPHRSELRQDIVGWAAKGLVYHTSNPSSRAELRVAPIDYQRDPTRFVFNYWWNCYLSGIKSTVLR